MQNDDQPLLPFHLIDGDSETCWSTRLNAQPDRNPEWIRIDLPTEAEVARHVCVLRKKSSRA